jgi:hypothetical protein
LFICAKDLLVEANQATKVQTDLNFRLAWPCTWDPVSADIVDVLEDLGGAN